MNVMVLDPTDDVEMIREVGEEWTTLTHEIEYGLPIDINIGLDTMRRLVMQSDGDVLVLVHEMKVVGFVGLSYRLNHVGPGKIANECCFFVSTKARSKGLLLKRSAEKLAKSKGCNFIIWNASKIAGDSNRSGKFYERDGGLEFETSYLKRL